MYSNCPLAQPVAILFVTEIHRENLSGWDWEMGWNSITWEGEEECFWSVSNFRRGLSRDSVLFASLQQHGFLTVSCHIYFQFQNHIAHHQLPLTAWETGNNERRLSQICWQSGSC